MSVSDELKKLADLHAAGGLTDEEFAAAKAAVLSGATTPGPAAAEVQTQLDTLQREAELLRLDRDWEREREQHMIRGKYGSRHVPTRGLSMITGVVVVGFGLFWTVMAFSITSGFPAGMGVEFFPCFGFLFILAGAAMSVYAYTMAVKYEQAEQRYHRRRRAVEEGRPISSSDSATAP